MRTKIKSKGIKVACTKNTNNIIKVFLMYTK